MNFSNFNEHNNINKNNENDSENESNNLDKSHNEKDRLLKVIKTNSNNHEAFYKLGHIYYKEKNYNKAIEYYKLAKIKLTNIEKKGDLYTIYTDSNKIIDKISHTPNILQAYKYRGFDRFKVKKYKNAIVDLQNLFFYEYNRIFRGKIFDSYIFGLNNVSNSFYIINDSNKKILSRWEVIDGDANIPYMLGLSYFKAGKYDNAYYPMLLVTELDPNHAEAFFHVGRIKHLNLNKYYPHSIESLRNSVIEDYSKAIELNPKHYEAIKYRGKLYFDNGKYAGEYEKALQAFEAISSHYSKDCEFLIDFGDTYYNLNRYESAIKVYDQVLEDKHFKNNIVQDNYSDLFDEYKKNKKKLLENPENIEANYYFAGLYYHSDQYEKSLVLLNKVIEIDQDESRAYYYRGRCYFTSHPEKALLDFYKTLEIMHKYKQEKLMNVHSQSIFDYIYSYDIYEWLSRCYLDLQKHREALLYFNKFIENGGKCNKFHIMDIVREISLNTIRDEELPKIHKYLNQLFTILPCTKCNDKNFKVLRPNTSFDGLEIECTVCKKKIWVKTDKTIPDEYIESIKDWISLEKAFEIIISSNYEAVKKQNRLTISSSVRQEVWRRDEGKCVNCGSRENLEYDHIIPVSKGGSNTVRNIELLCEKCNREKTSKIQ